ncbi:hypothetical protein GYMLUDRAFT_48019 [Collybiopsis luxurians FD-317 M1]|uniref:Uncharacterized protein n=1 Tax=Collybiopsis luxurians FD-317 M1 TaxID=944289 RepID=A0A0D0CAN1_9AGAR|nr:hypothetical protein GYMLUDRAFT_48019 [Collybiopsis luxurians FD-317 M1]
MLSTAFLTLFAPLLFSTSFLLLLLFKHTITRSLHLFPLLSSILLFLLLDLRVQRTALLRSMNGDFLPFLISARLNPVLAACDNPPDSELTFIGGDGNQVQH